MYYPESQITTNLYSNGETLIYKQSQKTYIGYYWKTSSGKFFTGKTPNELNIQELIEAEIAEGNTNSSKIFYSNDVGSNILNSEYSKLNKSFEKSLLLPTSYSPKPNSDDYNLGEFPRYFVKKSNEIIYMEVDKDTYNFISKKDPSYLWQLYYPFSFQWILTGKKEDVYFTNKKVVEYMSANFPLPRLNSFLKEDYLKFYK